MADREVVIVGVGAFIAPVGTDRRRPYQTGDKVLLPEDIAEQLVGDGVATLVPSPTKTLDEMTAAQLRQVASKRGVELGDAKSKPEILAVLAAAE